MAYTDEFSDFLGAGGGSAPEAASKAFDWTSLFGPIGMGASVVSTIAKMWGAQEAKERERKEREKREALAQAMWMSGRREQAVGRWG